MISQYFTTNQLTEFLYVLFAVGSRLCSDCEHGYRVAGDRLTQRLAPEEHCLTINHLVPHGKVGLQ